MSSNLAVTELGVKAGSAAAVSESITAVAAAPQGSLVCLGVVSDGSSNVGGASDARGNTYVQTANAGAGAVFNTSADRLLLFFSYLTAAIQIGDAISYANSVGSTFKQMQAFAITGQQWGPFATAGDANPAVKSNQGSGTALQGTLTGVLKQLDEIMINAYGYAGAGTFTPTAPDSQTGLTNVVTSNGFNLAMTYRIVTATTSIQGAATLGTAGVWAAISASVRASMASMVQQPTIWLPTIRAANR